ncbi:hypothetical protein SK128_018571 [Halocaridina rubra]|uniref:G-protein coupled receptors family 1 profile domain-containing protein n=1 Tax=Halocaridina rubra TaxID=373956 RepID=A0AAN8WY61_HALRR
MQIHFYIWILSICSFRLSFTYEAELDKRELVTTSLYPEDDSPITKKISYCKLPSDDCVHCDSGRGSATRGYSYKENDCQELFKKFNLLGIFKNDIVDIFQFWNIKDDLLPCTIGLSTEYCLQLFQNLVKTNSVSLPYKNVFEEFKKNANISESLYFGISNITVYNSWKPLFNLHYPIMKKFSYYDCAQNIYPFPDCNRIITVDEKQITHDNHCLKRISGTNKNSFSLIVPTILWTCPGKMQNQDPEMIGRILASLSVKNRLLPSVCEILLCNALYIEKLSDRIYIVGVHLKELSEIKSCQMYSSNTQWVSNETVTFSLYIRDTITEVLFFVSQATDILSLAQPFFRCCNYYDTNNSLFFPDMYSFWQLCYGVADSCKSVSPLWTTLSLANDRYHVVMRDDIKNSRLMQWLSTLFYFGDLPTAIVNYISNLSCHYQKYNFFIKVNYCYVNSSDLNIFKQFVKVLEDRDIICDENLYYTVCHKPNISLETLSENSHHLIFIHNCSVSYPNDDKATLLVINNILNIQSENEYICQENTWVALTKVKLLIVYYYIRGAELEGKLLLNQLKYDQPAAVWLERADLGEVNLSKCQNISETRVIRRVIHRCAYYSDNVTGIVVEVIEIKKYQSLTFPFTSNKTEVNHKRLPRPRTGIEDPKSNAYLELICNMKTHQFNFLKSEVNPVSHILEKTNPDLQGQELTVLENARLVSVSMIVNDTKCIADLLDHAFSLKLFNISEPLEAILGPMGEYFDEPSCMLQLSRNYLMKYQDNFWKNMTTINKFWPTCLYNMGIIWKKGERVVVDWDYLSHTCKLKEYALLSLSFMITFITILGNMLALTIILKTELMYKRSFMIYISLAMADGLLGLVPGTLAVYDHYSLMRGTLALSHFENSSYFADDKDRMSVQPPGFQQLRFARTGYPVFSSIVMNVSIYVSLLSLALLSIERFRVLIGSKLSRSQMIVGIVFTWFLSITISILVNLRTDGWFFKGYFDPVTKLTTNLGAANTSVSSVAFYVGVVVAGVASVIVLCLTVAAIFLIHRQHVRALENQCIHDNSRKRKMNYMTRTFFYSVIMFLIACIPLSIDLYMDFSRKNPVGHFLCWWLFMAGASWNWALYCFRGPLFRLHARKIFHTRSISFQSSFV